MSILGAIKSAFTSGVKELNKEYSKSNDFLAGVCASCALVANADGVIEDSERKKAIEVLTSHSQISQLYSPTQISTALNAALDHSTTASGKQELARQLDAVLGNPSGAQMAEDVYLVAVDVAGVGGIGDEEKAVLEKIAKRLHVDTSKFEF